MEPFFRSGSTQSDDPYPEVVPETVQVDPLSLQLAEAGSITLAVAAFFKEMHSVGTTKSGPVNPGKLWGYSVSWVVFSLLLAMMLLSNLKMQVP